MKKFLILFLLSGFFSLTSCSSDDEVNASSRLVGDWTLVSVEPAIIDPTACTNSSTIRVGGDNNITSNFYLEQNNCDLSTAAGTWKYNGNSSYTLDLAVVGEVTGTVSFPSSDSFTFTTTTAVYTFNRLL